MTSGYCPARNSTGVICRRPAGHGGVHVSVSGDIEWLESPRACEYCQKTDGTRKRNGETVCGQCSEDLDRGDGINREQEAREEAADRRLDEWKERR